MSDAEATRATEQCRELVADPTRMGLTPRHGLEPLDVTCRFNRAASHTSAAYQIHVSMKLSLDGSGNPPFTEATALVAQGRTRAECLEVFYNWMADETAVARFVEVVKAHEARNLDVLAQAALSERAAEESRVAQQSKERTREWFDKKFDYVGRKLGVIKPKLVKT